MQRTTILVVALACATAWKMMAGTVLGATTENAVSAKKRPNVVLVMTDDQGYGDLSCHGNEIIQTPHMDRLSRESIRLTNFHVDSTCSPTRAALLTGSYSHRCKVWNTTSSRDLLSDDLPTMAEAFKAAGYRTGHFGKWHLGGNYPYRPQDRGFDVSVTAGNGGVGMVDDVWGNDRVNDVLSFNGQLRKTAGFSCDHFFGEAIRFISKNKNKPFFIYLPTYLPHNPQIVPEKKWVDPYRSKVPLNAAYFYACIARVDHQLGRLRKHLQDEDLADNTLVIFLTDNGSAAGSKIFNAGMRGSKGQVEEGGHRVPCFLHWPAGALTGGKDIDTLTAHLDLFPTLVSLCGLSTPENAQFDGRNLRPLLYAKPVDWPSRAFVVEQQRRPFAQKGVKYVVMRDRWRLINNASLYDVSADLGQKKNLAKEHPKIVAQLRADYDRYWKSVSKGDKVYQAPIAGSAHQTEIQLSGIEAIPQGKSRQENVHTGVPIKCSWPLRIAAAGKYRVELRRWPREIDSPIAGPCKVPAKKPDAFVLDQPVDGLSFGGRPGPGKVFPATSIELRAGDLKKTAAITAEQTSQTFVMDLPAGQTTLTATLFDSDDKPLKGGVYYIYIRPVAKTVEK